MKPRDISRSQSQFPASFQQMDPVPVLFLDLFHGNGCSIRRMIIDDQYVKVRFKAQYLSQDPFDVLYLVEGWYDDQSAAQDMVRYKSV